MPIYSYICEKDGEFDDFKKIEERHLAKCPTCLEMCPHVLTTNQFAAKTSYIAPPMATRKFGDDRPSPYKRAKWQ